MMTCRMGASGSIFCYHVCGMTWVVKDYITTFEGKDGDDNMIKIRLLIVF